MSNHKRLAIINMLTGGLLLFFVGLFLLVLLPNIIVLYREFPADNTQNFQQAYFVAAVMLVIGVVNLFLGILNIISGKENERYVRFGKIALIGGFVAIAIGVPMLVMTMVNPLYSLTTSF